MDNCANKKSFRLDRLYIVGENRPVKLKVHDTSSASFVITDATYQVIDKNHEVVTEGRCEIDNDEHTVMFWFNPLTPGIFTLEFEVTVPPAVRIIDLTATVKAQGDRD